jgi:hypothetical protein
LGECSGIGGTSVSGTVSTRVEIFASGSENPGVTGGAFRFPNVALWNKRTPRECMVLRVTLARISRRFWNVMDSIET